MPTSLPRPIQIPATEARRQFGEILRRVHSGKEHFIIVKDGLPAAVMISPHEYETFATYKESQQMSRHERLKEMEGMAQIIYQKASELGLSHDEITALFSGSGQKPDGENP